MEEFLVVQSHDSDPPGWVSRCVESVQQWAKLHGYGYEFVDDALFDYLTEAERSKLAGRTPIMADLARLRWCADRLAADAAARVVWIDADTLVFAPRMLKLASFDSAIFGRERWLQTDPGGREKRYKNVHNAFCGFARDGSTLPFLIDTTTRLVERIDPQRIAPQFIGPKLLSALHSIVGFELDERFGAISPELSARLLLGDDAPTGTDQPGIGAANLCRSLAGEMDHARLVDTLLGRGERFL